MHSSTRRPSGRDGPFSASSPPALLKPILHRNRRGDFPLVPQLLNDSRNKLYTCELKLYLLSLLTYPVLGDFAI